MIEVHHGEVVRIGNAEVGIVIIARHVARAIRAHHIEDNGCVVVAVPIFSPCITDRRV